MVFKHAWRASAQVFGNRLIYETSRFSIRVAFEVRYAPSAEAQETALHPLLQRSDPDWTEERCDIVMAVAPLDHSPNERRIALYDGEVTWPRT